VRVGVERVRVGVERWRMAVVRLLHASALDAKAAIAATSTTCGCMAFPAPARGPCTRECPAQPRQHRSENQTINPDNNQNTN
jgi:hypothetical protein